MILPLNKREPSINQKNTLDKTLHDLNNDLLYNNAIQFVALKIAQE